MNRPESPQIAAIKERYKMSFDEKIALLKTHHSGLSEGAYSMPEIHANLHKLAGSSGMYGYGDINNLCRAAMASATAKKTSDLASDIDAIIRLLEQYFEN
jgi:hypothetical protein